MSTPTTQEERTLVAIQTARDTAAAAFKRADEFHAAYNVFLNMLECDESICADIATGRRGAYRAYEHNYQLALEAELLADTLLRELASLQR